MSISGQSGGLFVSPLSLSAEPFSSFGRSTTSKLVRQKKRRGRGERERTIEKGGEGPFMERARKILGEQMCPEDGIRRIFMNNYLSHLLKASQWKKSEMSSMDFPKGS